MEQFTYARMWSRNYKAIREVWDEARAREAHEKRAMYVVVIGDPLKPACFIEMTGDSFAVEFLDDELRSELTYDFEEKEPGRVFLTMINERAFEGDTDRVVRGSTYYFDTDGTVTIEDEDFDAEGLSTAKGNNDVSRNWDDYPEFGKYASIIRRER